MTTPFLTSGLTSTQQEAFQKILRFFTTSSANAFVLNGYAGTGKTYLMKYVVEYLLASRRKTVLMAPTGRAARILGSRTGHKASTIHRAIYGFVNEELTSKDAYLIDFKLTENDDPDNTVYIIDEASMVSDTSGNNEVFRFGSGRLLFDLLSFADLQGTNRKLIFVGDNAQLPPVDMNFSPALDRLSLAQEFNLRVESTTLSEVVRQQQNNSVLKLATGLRNQIIKAIPDSVHIGADGEQVLEADTGALRISYARDIRNTDFPRSIWICHTNKATMAVNEEIRAALGLFKQKIEPGELLMVTQNNYSKDVLLMNGDLIKAETVSTRREVHSVLFNYRQRKGIRKDLVFRDLGIRHSQYPNLKLSVKVLENSLSDDDDHLINAALYVLCQSQYREDNKGLDFSTFKKENPYYTCLKVRYGYAITCHKAQGGEWEHVIVDFDHQAGVYSKAFLRWAYTAVTRSSGKLWVINPVFSDALSGFVVNQVAVLKRKRLPVPPETTGVKNPNAADASSEEFSFLKPALQRMGEEAEVLGYKLETEKMHYRIRNTLVKENNAVCQWDMLYTAKLLKPQISGKKSFSDTIDTDELIACVQNAAFRDNGNRAASEADLQTIVYPNTERIKRMAAFISKCCEKAGVKITGFLEHDWQDIWLLETDEPGAELGCFYNKNQKYTYVEPRSVKGGYDEKLMLLTTYLALK
ncbi:MAG: AAA family ATPase [Balneolia bacterium]|nr:AAA family ATPase [Balneolia bacterium]